MKSTLEAMPDEVRELAHPWRPLAGSIPLLKPELEMEFRFGQRVIYFNGLYRFGGNIKGGSSSIWQPSSREHYECYTRWRNHDGIPEQEDRAAYDRLHRFLGDHGVELLNGNYPPFQQNGHRYVAKLGYVYRLAHEILSRLPAAHVAPPTFRQLQLGGWGPDCAKASAYEDGAVMIYDFAIEGARRTFFGLLLHELGHAHESRLAPDTRRALEAAFDPIRRAGAVLGVEFLLDAETRRIYQLRFFEEFLAELYLIYTTQGTRLRELVAALSGDARKAWDLVYAAFADSFGGVEYP